MRLGTRRLLILFLAAILVAGQWAGQRHAQSHAWHDLEVAVAAAGSDGLQHEGRPHAPPLDHGTDHCVAFHALDNASAETPLVEFAPAIGCHAIAQHRIALRPAEPLPFSSRAPPQFS